MNIVGEDDKFYLTDTGGRIAKNGLSPDKSAQFQSLIAQAPNAELNAPQDATPSSLPPMTSPWDNPAPVAVNSPDQLGMPQMPQQQAYDQPMLAMPPEITALGKEAMGDVRQGIALQQVGAKKQAVAIEKMNQEAERELLTLQRQQDMTNFQIMQDNEARDARVSETLANIDTLRNNYAQAKIDPDRFFGGSTGKRIMAGIAIAFGELGRGLTGSNQNTALNIIQKAIDDDIAAQKESMGQKERQITLARQGLADINELFKNKNEAQLAQKAIAIESAQNQIKMIAGRYNTQEAFAKADMLVGQLEVSKGEALSKLAQIAASDVERQQKAVPKAKEPSQWQYQASVFAERLDEAERNFRQLEKEGFDRTSKANAIWETIKPESLESEQWRRQSQAERNFVNAVLRRESGAAISSSEFDSAERQYFPRAGDTKKVIDQKRRNREIVMEGLFREAGQLAQKDNTEQMAAQQRQFLIDHLNRTAVGGR
jgi:hypothetical protein